MTCLIGYENHSDDAAVVFSGGAWTIPLSNLVDPRPSRKARSVGLTLANTKYRVALAASKTIRLIAITHTNLTSAALYRVTWYSDAFVTPLGNSGWLPIPGYPSDDPDLIGAAIFHIQAATSARWWEFEFDDQLNPDGYIEVGRHVMPTTYEPPYNFQPGATEGVEPNTPRQNALGGTGYFNRRKPVRQLVISWPVLPTSELVHYRRIRKLCNLNKQIVIVPDPSDTSAFNERNFLATLAEMPPIELIEISNFAIGFRAIEVI